MNLLALETAYDICGAAVFADNEMIAIEELRVPRRHNIYLADLTAKCLTSAQVGFADLDALAVSSGPGSYTGLRIGNSYAKGVAFGANLPIIPVPSLPAMALSAGEDELAAVSGVDGTAAGAIIEFTVDSENRKLIERLAGLSAGEIHEQPEVVGPLRPRTKAGVIVRPTELERYYEPIAWRSHVGRNDGTTTTKTEKRQARCQAPKVSSS